MLKTYSDQNNPAEWAFPDSINTQIDFITFTKFYSGSSLKPNRLATPNGNQVCVRNILHQDESTRIIEANSSMHILGCVPFAEDGLGNYIGICLSKYLHGNIVFWDHEARYSLADGLEKWIIAESIGQFENDAVIFEDDDDLPPFDVLESWVDPDFKPEFD